MRCTEEETDVINLFSPLVLMNNTSTCKADEARWELFPPSFLSLVPPSFNVDKPSTSTMNPLFMEEWVPETKSSLAPLTIIVIGGFTVPVC